MKHVSMLLLLLFVCGIGETETQRQWSADECQHFALGLYQVAKARDAGAVEEELVAQLQAIVGREDAIIKTNEEFERLKVLLHYIYSHAEAPPMQVGTIALAECYAANGITKDGKESVPL